MDTQTYYAEQLANKKIFLGDIARKLEELYHASRDVTRGHKGYGHYNYVSNREGTIIKYIYEIKNIFNAGRNYYVVQNPILKAALKISNIEIEYYRRNIGWGNFEQDISESTLGKIQEYIEDILEIPYKKWKNPYKQ